MSSNIGKDHLEIPLLRLSSDDEKRTLVKNTSFENYFAQSFSKWLGIRVANFSQISDIFDNVNQTDTLNSQKNLITNHAGDKAIDILNFR